MQKEIPVKSKVLVFSFTLAFSTLSYGFQCSESSKKEIKTQIKRQETNVKYLKETIQRSTELNKGLNDFSAGAVMNAMRTSIKVASYFASEESKNKIKSFFLESLSVDLNKKLDLSSIDTRTVDTKNISSNSDIISSLDEAKTRYSENLTILKDQSAQIVKKEKFTLNTQLNEIKSYSKSIPGMGTLEETSNTALEQENTLALNKSNVIILNKHIEELKLIDSVCK